MKGGGLFFHQEVLLKLYTQRDAYVCLVMGCYINTDTTFIYTVQAVER